MTDDNICVMRHNLKQNKHFRKFQLSFWQKQLTCANKKHSNERSLVITRNARRPLAACALQNKTFFQLWEISEMKFKNSSFNTLHWQQFWNRAAMERRPTFSMLWTMCTRVAFVKFNFQSKINLEYFFFVVNYRIVSWTIGEHMTMTQCRHQNNFILK